MSDHSVYLRYTDAAVVLTREVQVGKFIGDTVVVDFDALGEVVGIEVLGVTSVKIDGKAVT